MMRNGIIYGLQTLAHRTEENASLSWPTPQASDGDMGEIIGKDDTFYTTKKGVLRKVNRNGIDGNPGLARAIKYWRTPNARDHHSSQVNQDRPDAQIELDHQVSELANAKLNPEWVENLQGFPIGWTKIE
jgi:hypothetical protein